MDPEESGFGKFASLTIMMDSCQSHMSINVPNPGIDTFYDGAYSILYSMVERYISVTVDHQSLTQLN